MHRWPDQYGQKIMFIMTLLNGTAGAREMVAAWRRWWIWRRQACNDKEGCLKFQEMSRGPPGSYNYDYGFARSRLVVRMRATRTRLWQILKHKNHSQLLLISSSTLVISHFNDYLQKASIVKCCFCFWGVLRKKQPLVEGRASQAVATCNCHHVLSKKLVGALI